MQESRSVTEIEFFYQSLNIDKAVSPYQVWNKVNTGTKEGLALKHLSKGEISQTPPPPFLITNYLSV
jgi:hypothetical protein